MSKAKGKEKKNEPSTGVDAMVNAQKREILEHTFTIRQLQERLSRMTQQNHEIVDNRDSFQSNYEQKVDKQRIIIETHENTIRQLRNKVYELQITRMTLDNKTKDLERECRNIDEVRTREMDEYQKRTNQEILKFQTQLKEYYNYMNTKEIMEMENQHLKKNLESQKKDKIREVADKEREKIKATDKLRDQMLIKIRDMRSNLLSLKKEQLSTTTRLAVLQNHQLTSELQFQSKESQKIIIQNEHLRSKVSNLQKDLSIHKDIQDELAKRSHYSRGIIKKLTAKISELQQSLKQSQDAKDSNNKQSLMVSQQDMCKKGEMIKALDMSLQYTEKKYIKLQTDLDSALNQANQMRDKMKRQDAKVQNMVVLLSRYYQDTLNSSIEVGSQQYQFDFKAMRKRNFEDWSASEVKLVVTLILNQMGAHLNRRILGIPIINKNLISITDDDELITKFPRISQHSAVMKGGMNKIKGAPIAIASKIVSSHVREWGRTVHTNSVANLSRKYRVAEK